MTQKFTGKERDGETGLDYFGARYLGSGLGRFSSPDEPLLDQDPSDPQSWNLYAYVRNNPLIFADPSGNDCVYVNSAGDGVDRVDNQNTSADCRKTNGYWVDGTVTNARFAHGSLILTGTTNGENRTEASYGLGPDPGMMALQGGMQQAQGPVNALAGASLAFAGIAGGTAVGVAGVNALAPAFPEALAFIPRAVTTFANKQAARAGIAALGLTGTQAQEALRTISRATSTSTVQIIKAGQQVIVSVTRLGRDGYQQVEKFIDPSGNVRVVQKGINAAGELSHYHIKR